MLPAEEFPTPAREALLLGFVSLKRQLTADWEESWGLFFRRALALFSRKLDPICQLAFAT